MYGCFITINVLLLLLLLLSNSALPLGPEQVLLRGAMLKNTKWIFGRRWYSSVAVDMLRAMRVMFTRRVTCVGIVVYTGHESKLMLNSKSAPLKRSTVEKVVNRQILLLLGMLIGLSLLTAIANEMWTQNAVKHNAFYMGFNGT